MKTYIAWAIDNQNDGDVINCGEFSTVEMAEKHVASLGLEVAEIETVFRHDSVQPRNLTVFNRAGDILRADAIPADLTDNAIVEYVGCLFGGYCTVFEVFAGVDYVKAWIN